MKKFFLAVSLIVLIVPSVAFASWWNPFSWSIFHRTDTKTQILENRVRELEQKLNSSATSTTTDRTSVASSTTKENSQPPSVPVTTKAKQPIKETSVIPSAPVINNVSATPSTPKVDRDALYADVVQKYTNFQSTITSERSGLAKNSSLPTERAYFTYLNDILNKINSDLGYLGNIKGWSSRPVVEETYLAKFNNLKNDYDIRARSYRVDFEEERTTASQQNLEELEQQVADSARKNSPECKQWTATLNDIKTQIKPLSDVGTKRYNEYLITGKYTTPDLSSSDRSKLTDLMLRQSGAQNQYYYYCEGFVPSSPKTTSCSFYGNTMICN